MVDSLAWRKRIASLIPATNTIVEPDFHQMRIPGVTAHTGRVSFSNIDISTDNATAKLVREVRANIGDALERLLSVNPDTLIMGMSLESFFDDDQDTRATIAQMLTSRGVAFVDARDALHAAFDALQVKRVAVLTPYQPDANRMVRREFTRLGVEVVALHSVACASAHAIAEVPEHRLCAELTDLKRFAPEVIVQSGTNLSMLRLADEAERWLGVPVIAINALLWWRALRVSGIDDRRPGFGVLLRNH